MEIPSKCGSSSGFSNVVLISGTVYPLFRDDLE